MERREVGWRGEGGGKGKWEDGKGGKSRGRMKRMRGRRRG